MVRLDGYYYVSNIQDYSEYMMKKHETLPKIYLIHAYINGINYRLVYK